MLIVKRLLLQPIRGCCSSIKKSRTYTTPQSAHQSEFPDRFQQSDKIDARSSDKISEWSTPYKQPHRNLDTEFLCNERFHSSIEQQIRCRGSSVDMTKIKDLTAMLEKASENDKDSIQEKLCMELSKIPNVNKTSLLDISQEPKECWSPSIELLDDDNSKYMIDVQGRLPKFKFKPKSIEFLGEKLGLFQMRNLGLSCVHRGYYLIGSFAKLEQALVNYTLQTLYDNSFDVISVPDFVYPEIVDCSGFPMHSDGQIYKIGTDSMDTCLIGTSELPLAGYLSNELFRRSDLPMKLAAVSRCYRAEASNLPNEKGIYRVHEFTKVEMFGVTADDSGDESIQLLKSFVDLQRKMFQDLGLHFRVLDMPPHELGLPAAKKIDMEAIMPAKRFWGEISSASLCTDYQSRRHNIQYWDDGDKSKFVHTVNGTACAIPRMIMAIVEANQNKDWSVNIPEVLQPYMNGQTILTASDGDRLSDMTFIRGLRPRD